MITQNHAEFSLIQLNYTWIFSPNFSQGDGGGGTQVVIVYCFYSHTEGAFEIEMYGPNWLLPELGNRSERRLCLKGRNPTLMM